MVGKFSLRMSFGRRVSVLTLALMFTLVFSVGMQASMLPPGTLTALPDFFGTPVSGMHYLTSTVQPFVNTLGTTSGTITSAVFSDDNNVYGAGDLDFLYQVTNNTTSTNCGSAGQAVCDPVNRETDTNFAALLVWLTDAGFRIDGAAISALPGVPAGLFINGTIQPQTVDRTTLSGDVVGFGFNTGITPTPINPGQVSFVLVIETNAKNWQPGNASVIDGGVTTKPAFQPSSAIPEPTSMLLIGGGLIALAGLRRFRKS